MRTDSKECQFREHETQSRDQERPDSQATDDVMVESSTEENIASSSSPGCPDSPGAWPQEQADAEGAQAGASEGTLTISAEEEQILMGDQAPATGRSLASDMSSVAGHLASLHVHTPPHEVPEGGDTSK